MYISLGNKLFLNFYLCPSKYSWVIKSTIGLWTIYLAPGSRCEHSSSNWHRVCRVVGRHLGRMEGRSESFNLVQDQNACSVLRKTLCYSKWPIMVKLKETYGVSFLNLRTRNILFYGCSVLWKDLKLLSGCEGWIIFRCPAQSLLNIYYTGGAVVDTGMQSIKIQSWPSRARANLQ